jgi:hypothetical protein
METFKVDLRARIVSDFVWLSLVTEHLARFK